MVVVLYLDKSFWGNRYPKLKQQKRLDGDYILGLRDVEKQFLKNAPDIYVDHVALIVWSLKGNGSNFRRHVYR